MNIHATDVVIAVIMLGTYVQNAARHFVECYRIAVIKFANVWLAFANLVSFAAKKVVNCSVMHVKLVGDAVKHVAKNWASSVTDAVKHAAIVVANAAKE